MMNIIITGNKKEVAMAKAVMEFTCIFNSEYCESGLHCDECNEKQGLKINYIVEESEESKQCNMN